MALRDQFLQEEATMMAPQQPTPEAPAVGAAEVAAKMGEADAAFNDAMSEANPVGDFSGQAINVLIGKVNNTLKLFGDQATEIPQVEGNVSEFPTELTKAIAMIEKAAVDSGAFDDIVGLDGVQSDQDVKRLAGEMDAIGKNSNFKTFLASMSGDMNATLIVEMSPEELEGEPVASEEPEMDEEELEKLFKSRM